MVDCSGFIQPLNLECILVNLFAGSMDTFVILAFIAIAVGGAYFRMMNATLLIMFCLFAIIMGSYLSGIFFVIILLVGIVSAFVIGGIVRR